MPSQVLSNIRKRLKLIHMYGPEVFQELLIDPYKTLSKDVIPRFINSEYYYEMIQRLNDLYPLPIINELQLPLPLHSNILSWSDSAINIENITRIELQDILQDSILYNGFLKYTKTIFTEENLYFARAITLFKLSFINNKNTKDSINYSWLIFRYFICMNSIYEISINTRKRKEIMQSLANPDYTLYDNLEYSVYNILRPHYAAYSNTTEFLHLIEYIKNHKIYINTNIKSPETRKIYDQKMFFPLIQSPTQIQLQMQSPIHNNNYNNNQYTQTHRDSHSNQIIITNRSYDMNQNATIQIDQSAMIHEHEHDELPTLLPMILPNQKKKKTNCLPLFS